ncbi:anti-sigma factor family protein [Planctomycetota bacterium]
MMSCEDYQKTIVTALDCEGSEQQEKRIFAHLADCQECRTVYAEAIRTRQLFSIATATKNTVTIGQQFVQAVEAEVQKGRNSSHPTETRTRTELRTNFHGLVWAGGVAAAVLLAVSWLACYWISREVTNLRSQLQGTQQELASARAQSQREEDHDREQRAITALYLRMAELEKQVERSGSHRPAFYSVERNGL